MLNKFKQKCQIALTITKNKQEEVIKFSFRFEVLIQIGIPMVSLAWFLAKMLHMGHF